MDILDATEVVFPDTFAPKPSRTLVVNTNAPLHSVNGNVEPSCGVATFSPESQFSDRFIIWRAVGQKLYLEERSLCRTVEGGSLCLDFARTPIVPGTSISILEQSVLCIVVPTQSTVHRFTARLIFDPLHLTKSEVPSMFDQIQERDFLVHYHDSYMLTTNGHALKASVIHQNDITKVAYCMAEGQLVVVSMVSHKADRCEEIVYRESSFISRVIGGTGNGVSDVFGISNDNEVGGTFYATYGDGFVRAWSSEQPTNHMINLANCMPTEYRASHVSSIACRAYKFKNFNLVVVAVNTTTDTQFVFLRDHNQKLRFMTCLVGGKGESLLDFDITYRSGCKPRLWAVWNSAAVANEYSFQFIGLKIDAQSISYDNWSTIAARSRRDHVSLEMSTEALKGVVFNSECHPFDVVYRAVQISCEGHRCEAQHGNWQALSEHIEKYKRSREFDAKYLERGRSIRTSSKEAHVDAEKRFYFALASACDELEIAARGPIGLLSVDVPGVCIVGLVQKDRFTIVNDPESDIVLVLHSYNRESLESIVALARQRSTDNEPESDDSDAEPLNVTQPAISMQHVAKDWSDILEDFVRIASQQIEETPSDGLEAPLFAGAFTAGLVSARLMHVTRTRLAFIQSLILVMDMLRSERYFTTIPIDGITRLAELHLGYKLLVTQLNIKIPGEFITESIGSWLTRADRIQLLRKDGGALSDVRMEQNEENISQFNSYIEKTVSAAIRAVWPSSNCMFLYRALNAQKKFQTVQTLCNLTLHPPHHLIPALHFFKGVAHSGLDQPGRAMHSFNAAAMGVETGNVSLLRALQLGESTERVVTLGDYYTTVIRYLHEHGHSEEVVETAKAAIEKLPEGQESTSNIYITLFNHLVNRGNWVEALATIIDNKDEAMQRTTLRDLISRLLRARDFTTLTQLEYGVLEDQVESILMSEARSQDITSSPHLFEVVFSFYMYKMDFKKAAEVMYEYANTLKMVTQTPDLLKRRRDALACTSNLLDLLPEDQRFLCFPNEFLEDVEDDLVLPEPEDQIGINGVQPVKIRRAIRRKIMFILEAKRLCEEWAIANARVTLIAESNGKVPPLEPTLIVSDLIEAKQYDTAFDICIQCDVSPFAVLYAATREAIALDVQQPAYPPEWLNANRRRLEGRAVGDHWSVVRGLLSAAQKEWPTDSRPLRAVTTAILSHGSSVPCWLQAKYSEQDVSDYVRCLVDYDVIGQAVTVLTEKIENETDKIRSTDSITLLPYTVITEVINLAAKNTDEKALTRLNERLKLYLTRINAFETAARFGN